MHGKKNHAVSGTSIEMNFLATCLLLAAMVAKTNSLPYLSGYVILMALYLCFDADVNFHWDFRCISQ